MTETLTPEERAELKAKAEAAEARRPYATISEEEVAFAVATTPRVILSLLTALEEAEGRATEFEARWNHCRQSLAEQAEARLDPAMPLLTAKVVEELKSESEAWHAMADHRDGRVVAHGLGLLCDWQDKARALSPSKSEADSNA